MLGAESEPAEYSPAFWRKWKRSCNLAMKKKQGTGAADEAAIAKAEAQNAMDWLIVHDPPDRGKMEMLRKTRGEKIPSYAAISRVPRVRCVDFAAGAHVPRFPGPSIADREAPEPMMPPLPRSSMGEQVQSSMRSAGGGAFARTSRADWQRVKLGKQQKSIEAHQTIGPGSYDVPTDATCDGRSSTFGDVVGGGGGAFMARAARDARGGLSDCGSGDHGPGPVYWPSTAGIDAAVRGCGAFGSRSAAGSIDMEHGPDDGGPGPANVPPRSELRLGKGSVGAKFAGRAQGPLPVPAPTGVAARGCHGFGYASNLEECVKYGHSLDGQDSNRAYWEKSHNRSAASVGYVHEEEKRKSTALHFACSYGEADVVARLLDSGASVNAVDKNGKTPLHIASSKGFLRIVILLLDAPAFVPAVRINRGWPNPNIKDDTGMTPLHHASKNAHHFICERLLQAGSDATIEDAAGKTSAFYAGSQRTFQVLAGADKLAQGAKAKKWQSAGHRAMAGVRLAHS